MKCSKERECKECWFEGLCKHCYEKNEREKQQTLEEYINGK